MRHHHVYVGDAQRRELQETDDRSPPVDFVALADLMRPYLRTLHVQNYSLCKPIFRRLAIHRPT